MNDETTTMTPGQALFGFGCVLFLIVVAGCISMTYYLMIERLTATIETTYIKKTNSDGPDKFFVVVKKENGEQEVFQNTDSLTLAKFNSADINARLKPGEKIKLKVVGFRSPFLSIFRNVVEIERLEEK
jgi:hypothetical protein